MVEGAGSTAEGTVKIGELARVTGVSSAPRSRAPSVPAQDAAAPIACRANALDKGQRKRQQELLQMMPRIAEVKEELPARFAFRLPANPALFQQAAEWVTLERRCCPFVQFTLDWRQDDTVWIRFTGGPGVKAFLAAEILGSERLP